MKKNSKSVIKAKTDLKNLNKPFSVCLLNYIEELEKKAYKCEYYQEHADIFYNELKAVREDSAIDKYVIEKIKEIIRRERRESKSTFDSMAKLRDIKTILGE